MSHKSQPQSCWLNPSRRAKITPSQDHCPVRMFSSCRRRCSHPHSPGRLLVQEKLIDKAAAPARPQATRAAPIKTLQNYRSYFVIPFAAGVAAINRWQSALRRKAHRHKSPMRVEDRPQVDCPWQGTVKRTPAGWGSSAMAAKAKGGRILTQVTTVPNRSAADGPQPPYVLKHGR